MTSGARPASVAEALRIGSIDPIDARVLLEHVLGSSHAQLAAHPERPLSADERGRFLALAERRAAGEPVAYLVGWREFYGRRFRVSPAVLVPRPETELLVDLASRRIRAGSGVLDLGSGSGNIAITLALEHPAAAVTAVEASVAALEVAGSNAAALGATVEWLAGDWLAPIGGRRFDVIVSNPPYVADADPHLQAGDLRFEPASALRASADGLEAIRHIVQAAPAHLDPGGWLLIEHGYDQGDSVWALMLAAGLDDVATVRDLAGLPRVTLGRLR